jgi:hypothetical protein
LQLNFNSALFPLLICTNAPFQTFKAAKYDYIAIYLVGLGDDLLIALGLCHSLGSCAFLGGTFARARWRNGEGIALLQLLHLFGA